MGALRVYAIDENMNRCTGDIPYRSLDWHRCYYECGDFTLEVPASIYDPAWAYICTDERPETGIVQKVEYSDSSQVAGGDDSVIISGFFLESLLNRMTFLVEAPATVTYASSSPRSPYVLKSQLPTVYEKDGTLAYVNSSGETVTKDGEAVEVDESWTSMQTTVYGGRTSGEAVGSVYASRISGDEATLTTTAWDGTTETHDVAMVDDKGNAYLYDGEKVQVVMGVTDESDGTYTTSVPYWTSSGYTYTTEYVKGPWQRTDAEEPITEGDSVDIVTRWVQRFCGNAFIYPETGMTGVTKKVDPSLQLLGDLVYDTLKEVEASFRIDYDFASNKMVFYPYRGLDRTQDQEAEPVRRLPDGYTEVEWVQTSGSNYFNTGIAPNQATGIILDFMVPSENDWSNNHILSSNAQGTYFAFRVTAGGGGFSCRWGRQALASLAYSGAYADDRHELRVDRGSFSVDGQAPTSFSFEEFQQPNPLILGGLYNVSSVTEETITRVYSLKITHNGIEHEFVPCLDDFNNGVGLYDMQKKKFIPATGSGTVTHGEEVTYDATAQNPWAVFSDTWGTLKGFSASRDTSNYKNTCYVLYDYDEPKSYDKSGWPEAGFIYSPGNLLALPTMYGIEYTRRSGYLTETVGDEDEPAIETYLDLREEKPSCDDSWSRDVVELPPTEGDERDQAIEEAKAKFAPKSGSGNDLRSIYAAYWEDLHGRGAELLKSDYSVVRNLSTGELDMSRYLIDYDLGDKVDMSVETVGMRESARIVEVDELYSTSGNSVKQEISIEIGESLLSFSEKSRMV